MVFPQQGYPLWLAHLPSVWILAHMTASNWQSDVAVCVKNHSAVLLHIWSDLLLYKIRFTIWTCPNWWPLFGIRRVSQSDRKVVKPRLYKDEVRSIFTRAAVVHVHPGPPPVAARGDHVLEPGHLALDTVARAAIAKMRSACFWFTRDAHFFTLCRIFTHFVDRHQSLSQKMLE